MGDKSFDDLIEKYCYAFAGMLNQNMADKLIIVVDEGQPNDFLSINREFFIDLELINHKSWKIALEE